MTQVTALDQDIHAKLTLSFIKIFLYMFGVFFYCIGVFFSTETFFVRIQNFVRIQTQWQQTYCEHILSEFKHSDNKLTVNTYFIRTKLVGNEYFVLNCPKSCNGKWFQLVVKRLNRKQVQLLAKRSNNKEVQ